MLSFISHNETVQPLKIFLQAGMITVPVFIPDLKYKASHILNVEDSGEAYFSQ